LASAQASLIASFYTKVTYPPKQVEIKNTIDILFTGVFFYFDNSNDCSLECEIEINYLHRVFTGTFGTVEGDELVSQIFEAETKNKYTRCCSFNKSGAKRTVSHDISEFCYRLNHYQRC